MKGIDKVVIRSKKTLSPQKSSQIISRPATLQQNSSIVATASIKIRKKSRCGCSGSPTNTHKSKSFQILPSLQQKLLPSMMSNKRTTKTRNFHNARPKQIQTEENPSILTSINYPKLETPKRRSVSEVKPPYSETIPISKVTSNVFYSTKAEFSNYLPLDMYDPVYDPLSPEELLENYRASSPQAVGFSKWFFGNGTYEWRKCKISKFDPEKEQFIIQWPNGIEKCVSRINLRLENESESEFEERISEARKMREDAEISLRFNALITYTNKSILKISSKIVNAIVSYLRGGSIADLRKYVHAETYLKLPLDIRFNPKRFLWTDEFTHLEDEKIVLRERNLKSHKELISKLFPDLKFFKIFAFKQTEFGIFSRKRLFQLIDEVEKWWELSLKHIEFLSVNKRHLKDSVFSSKLENNFTGNKDGKINRPAVGNPSKFGSIFGQFYNTSLLNSVNTLSILQRIHDTILSIDQSNLFPCIPLKNMHLLNFIEKYRKNCEIFFNCIQNAIIDSQCDIQDILTKEDIKRMQRNEMKLKEKVHSMQVIELEDKLPSTLLHYITKLVQVCNMKIEDKARESLKKSLKFLTSEFKQGKSELKQILKQSIELDHNHITNLLGKGSQFINIELIINLVDNKIESIPNFEQFSSQVSEFIDYVLYNVSGLKCINTLQTGPSRVNGNLQILEINAESYQKNINKLYSNLEFQYKLIGLFLSKLEPYYFIISLDPVNLELEFKDCSTDEIEDEIFRLKRNEVEICEILNKENSLLGIWIMNTDKVLQFLVNNVEKAIQVLYRILLDDTESRVREINKNYNEVVSSIFLVPNNIEELEDMRQYIKISFDIKLQFIKDELVFIFNNIDVLEGYFYQIPYELYNSAWKCIGYVKDLLNVKIKSLNTISEKLLEFTQELSQTRIFLFANIEKMSNELKQLMAEDNINNYENMSIEFNILKNQLQEASKSSELMNSRETIIDEPLSNFKLLEETKREFNPYFKLWTFIQDFNQKHPFYMSGPLCMLNRDTVASEINTYTSEISRMEKSQFKENPAAMKVAKEFMAKVNEFRPYIPIIKIFNNPGMKERHWQEILVKTEIKFIIAKNTTLTHILNAKAMDHLELLDLVSEQANKELGLENAKKKMENEWNDINFEYIEFKNTYVLINTEKILDPLNEQLMRTNAMLSSPYIKFIVNEMTSWKNTLLRIQDIIENWEKFQRSWQYLQPIFASQDISKQLQQASSKFRSINSQWVSIMSSMVINSNVYEYCMGQPKLLDMLFYGNENLEAILKNLNEYLLSKRKDFPRFYFLSNDELVTILSNSQDITAIQRYIIKCFEGISTVSIENKKITGMISIEGEKVKFCKSIELYNGTEIKNIEIWLNDVEKEMIDCLKYLLEKCLFDDVSNLKAWVLRWPSQLIHASLMALWTSGAENSLRSGTVKKFLSVQEERLGSLVSIVRGNLTNLDRMTFSTMVVLDVHNKDIIESLVTNKVMNIDDFAWFSNMRYYLNDHLMEIKMLDCIRQYGYEYLGIAIRLVITKLTDRCYMTLMCALSLSLGGAPEGPAGTGKTETVKDLAKGLAMKCVVFNCSDRLDHVYMAKFFTGLCFCGAWACFDEFNRIELEVLSVIAEQILTIQIAVQKKADVFKMENDEVMLNLTVAVFITMNPDYAGRSKLPDNLKALFRPVAMMTPDYSLIAEIYLYSFGFREARNLAQKIVNSLKLSSEQLSSQPHYDYGMRAVATIIKAAGLYKQTYPDDQESKLVLKAIRGTNLPKFLNQDISLFAGIVSDLFPGSQEEESDEKDLIEDIKTAIREKSLSEETKFIEKAVEVYRTILLRHGLMVVGTTMAGKTAAIQVLAKALSYRSEVELFFLNPKSMTLGQLYGDNDPVSQDWKDGILALCIRTYAEKNSKGHQWVIMDGPVDAVWIESLNTVMDDNKKLCLSNGEIIKLTPSMRMIFEVDDLSQASPATVSRCGMIYMSPEDILSPHSIIKSWLNNLPLGFSNNEYKELFIILFDQIFIEILQYWNSSVKPYCTTPLSNMQVTRNTILIFQALIIRKGMSRKQHDLQIKTEEEEEKAKENQVEAENQSPKKGTAKGKLSRKNTVDLTKISDERRAFSKEKYINLFIVAMMWGLVGTCDVAGKKLLSQKIIETNQSLLRLPENFIDFFYDEDKQEWVEFDVNLNFNREDANLNTLLVPTVNVQACSLILNELIMRKEYVIVTGDTGTGKTFVVNSLLSKLDKMYSITSTMLSGRTGSNELQSFIESDLIRRKKNVIGPEFGKFKIFLIDDLNMPAKEKFGAVPPIELLRIIAEKGEIIDRTSLEIKTIEDFQFLSTTGHSGGGRIPISARYLSKNILINFPSYDAKSLFTIQNALYGIGLSNHPSSIQDSIPVLCKASISIFNKVSQILPPTPAKSHYSFNLRDILNILKGICLSPHSKLITKDILSRLWVHEALRTFSDRLIDDKDRETLKSIIKESFTQEFKLTWEDSIKKNPVFVNFMDDKLYQEYENQSRIKQTLENFLDDYNGENTVQMNLLMFDYAIEHICRISRVLSWSCGHLLLIGMGGSGRMSLTRLCAYIQKMVVFQIKVTKTYGMLEWYEDLKNILRSAGQDDKKTVFILRDSEIITEAFLESINCILNSGSVPNLYSNEETQTILEILKMVKVYSGLPPAQRWEIFLSNLKKNLHVVLCMFPQGEILRARLRQFPSLITCTYINWLPEWPEQALSKVAEFYLKEENFVESSKIDSVINICVFFHLSIRDLSDQYFQEHKRQNYITPNHFLILLRTLKHLYGYKEQTTIRLTKKYMVGILQLNQTQLLVEKLQKELIELKPILDEKTRLAEETVKEIEKENEEADKTRQMVAAEQEACQEQTNFAEGIKKECEEALAQTLPDLEAAIKSLDTIKKEDIDLVKAMYKPPVAVRITLEAVAIMNKQQPVKMKDPDNPLISYLDYYETGKKLLSVSRFIQKLKGFDRESLDEDTINKITPYINNPKFHPDIVKHASNAAQGMCKWVRAMYHFYFVNNEIKPKIAALAIAEKDVQEKKVILEEKEYELKLLESEIKKLQEKLEGQVKEKNILLSEVHSVELKMQRAVKLMAQLSDEKKAWEQKVENYSSDLENLLGDVLLSAGVVTYFGPFILNYREIAIYKKWLPLFKSINQIPCSDPYTLQKAIGEAETLQIWNICGLPSNKVSIENSLIIHYTLTWPLIVDPQEQASKWLKKMFVKYKVNIFKVKPESSTFMSTLENAMFLGASLLIEDLKDTVDPVLDPLLGKQWYKQDSSYVIKIGDALKDIDISFKLYMLSNYANPRFSPEVSTKVNLVNFSITEEGLAEQLLEIVCRHEMPKDTEERDQLILQSAEYMRNMQAFEDKILQMLQSGGDTILDNEELINSLTESKELSIEVGKKLINTRNAEQKILAVQNNFVPVSKASAVLYFCIADLSRIDYMYQFSMEWFLAVFKKGIGEAERIKDINERVKNITLKCREMLFMSILPSIQETDKLLFAFLISIKLQQFENQIEPWHLTFFLTGMCGLATTEGNQTSFLSDKSWREMLQLNSKVPGLRDHILNNKKSWENFIIHDKEFTTLPSFPEYTNTIPAPYNKESMITKMLILRCIKPEGMIMGIKAYIKSILGDKYLNPIFFTIASLFKETSSTRPLFFILTAGTDPMAILKRYSIDTGYCLLTVSLGKGQGEKAEALIKQGSTEGKWILLQNCHLASSWLPKLEAILEDLQSKFETHTLNNNFRLLLTASPNENIPVSILKKSIKVVSQMPTGLTNSLLGIYSNIYESKEEISFYEGSNKNEYWKKLFFHLSFFHCVIRERLLFGPIGWNVQYEFGESDFRISSKQLMQMVNQFSLPPFQVLNYLIAECNYGGKVTDDYDRRTLNEILETFCNPSVIFEINHSIVPVTGYIFPPTCDYSAISNSIRNFPQVQSPEVFGLHPNAGITRARKEAYDICARLLLLQPSTTNISFDQEKQSITSMADIILSKVSTTFDLKASQAKYQLSYYESMNTVLMQELTKFNILTKTICTSLINLKKVYQGVILMNDEYEALIESMLKNEVPVNWMKVSYISNKSLIAYIQDLHKRLETFNNWVENGKPTVFWISGFFSMQAFLTGTIQEYARKMKLPIDTLDFSFDVLNYVPDKAPEYGSYVNGLFLEGARWDGEKLEESCMRELFFEFPVVRFR